MPNDAALMDESDRRLLNLAQWEFPLEPQPFALLAGKLETTEEEVLQRILRLKEEKVIRQISAIFDSRRLGYKSCLVAARAPRDRMEAAAEVINRHPGVSHNYERNHDFNLWFTLTVPPDRELQAEADRLQVESGALSIRLLPTVKLFKIGVKLDVVGEKDVTRKDELQQRGGHRLAPELGERDIAAVRALQKDIPVETLPFRALASAAGMDEAELLDRGRQFIERGQMRRFAAVLRHRRAGFPANGMAVWSVPDDRIEQTGKQMAAFAAVSHCCYRPRYPDWPYNIFTMIHARSREECQQVVEAIARETGISDHTVLYSTREFKKVRVQYFEW